MSEFVSTDVIVCDRQGCRGREPQHMCSRCRRTFYCSVECQRKSWKEHKNKCIDFTAKFTETNKPTFRALPVPRNDGCSFCRRTPLDFPILLDCGHGVCGPCGVGRELDRLAGPDTHLECPSCRRESQTSATVKALELAKDLEVNAKHPQAIDIDRKEFTKLALDGLGGIFKKIDTYSPGIKDKSQVHRLLLKKASLLLLSGDAKDSLQAYEQAVEAWKQASLLTIKKPSAVSLLRDSGVSVRALVEADEDTTELAEALLTAAEAHEALEQWQEADDKYTSLLDQPDVEKQPYYNRLSCGRARCKRHLGDVDASLEIATSALKIDNVSPGMYKSLALAQQAKGDLESAKVTMSKAFYYEAPWDDLNQAENVRFLENLWKEQRLKEEERLRLEEFLNEWCGVFEAAQQQSDIGMNSWEAIKLRKYDMFADEYDADEDDKDDDEDEEKIEETRAKLEANLAKILENGEVEEDLPGLNLADDEIETTPGVVVKLDDAPRDYSNIKLTDDVVKWWCNRRTPKSFKEYFIRRLKQLAAGDRSRILNKRLTGSKNTTIFETYLEQKSGFRILWTEDSKRGLLIWFVSSHERVSRNMERIDKAESRSTRQRTHAVTNTTAVTEVESLVGALVDDGHDDLDPNQVLLDPRGDIPLRLYLLPVADINRMATTEWVPPLYMTQEERAIVEKDGTVLLLGRSGTGKTVCICNRIDRDRHFSEDDPTFSQLFVARSGRICNYVEKTVGKSTQVNELGRPMATFWTFRRLLDNCESHLFDHHPFQERPYMDYHRFKKTFPDLDVGLDYLVIWTQIRSFIKGSIEAVVKGSPLSREEYLDEKVIGYRGRCRLSPEHRHRAYGVFEKYEAAMQASNMWDDCDRIANLLRALQSNHEGRVELARRRVYVDEIQDYTQGEIALFFMLCDRGGLFFAGDPAQSVVEGVEFRFEEVRSVAYHLYPDDKRYIPEKPFTVTRNFRSHTGILNIAAEVLEKMFAAFPGSAKELGKDQGLFTGPRPGIFFDTGENGLKDLVSRIEGVVVLAMSDSDVKRIGEELKAEGTVVLTIRDSKGLEFSDVVLVDFFKNLPNELQKPWRLLQQGKGDETFRSKYPEIETQMKQLYTAITRCSKRLFFVETGDSDAGKAFVRWLTAENELAMKQVVDDLQESVKSPDEWNSTGVQYAIYAEGQKDDKVLFWLEKALYCFQQANDKKLQDKIMIHRESVEFREQWEDKEPGVDLSEEELETEVRRHLQKLTEEGLLFEARLFCEVLLPKLDKFTSRNLRSRLYPFLPDVDLL